MKALRDEEKDKQPKKRGPCRPAAPSPPPEATPFEVCRLQDAIIVYWKRPNGDLELVNCGLTQWRLSEIDMWRQCQSDDERALPLRDKPYLKGYPEVKQWDEWQPVFDHIAGQHAYTDAEEARALQEEG